jgi:hypothetical protein
VEERLLFDRVNALGAESAVNQAVKSAATILPNGTDASRSFIDQASKTAEAAADLPVAFPFIKHCFFHGHLPLPALV